MELRIKLKKKRRDRKLFSKHIETHKETRVEVWILPILGVILVTDQPCIPCEACNLGPYYENIVRLMGGNNSFEGIKCWERACEYALQAQKIKPWFVIEYDSESGRWAEQEYLEQF